MTKLFLQCLQDGKLFETLEKANEHQCVLKQQSGGLVGNLMGGGQQAGPRRYLIVSQD